MRLLAFPLLLLSIAGCQAADGNEAGAAGSGSGTQRSYPVTGFTGVDLAGADQVDVHVGSGYSVRAQGPAKELAMLRVDKRGDTLRIGRRGNPLNLGRDDKIKVSVTLPQLASAGVAGSGTMNVDRVKGSKFVGEVAGSGQLALASLAVDSASMTVAGSGTLRAAGTARTLEIDSTGSGTVDAAALTSGTASVSVTGSGGVRTAVNGAANVSMMGSGSVDLGPRAKCTISKMGSGTVRCGG